MKQFGVLFFLLSFAALSHAELWEYLGDTNVDGLVDHGIIQVKSSAGFRAIQLRVENNAIRFDRLIVHYADGVDLPIAVRSKVGPGGQTRSLSLPGNRRGIERVELYYDRADWGSRKPRVLLYGRR